MQKAQKEYDNKIQQKNRLIQILAMEKKLDQMENTRKKIYDEAQKDKKRNNRRETLCDYKLNLECYDNTIISEKQKLAYLKKRLQKDLFPNKDNVTLPHLTEEEYTREVFLLDKNIQRLSDDIKVLRVHLP